MSGIGPELPPHLLAKRKRQEDEDAESATPTVPGAKRSASPDEPEKRRKVMGPAMPPAPLDERPGEPADGAHESSSEDDDDFGPVLPTGGAVTKTLNEEEEDGIEANGALDAQVEAKPKRDDWMMMPPQQDDLAARLDPSKPRAKGFNTGKGAKGPSAKGDDSSAWHETPEQKQKRLQDEMMGVAKSAGPDKQRSIASSKTAKEAAAHEEIKQHVEKTRGPSLLEQHKASKGPDVEDDPSKRAFDRDKDMGSGARISSQQQREMLKKANLSGKFAGGSYL